MMDAGAVHHGELLLVPERVILAPAPGRFRPVDGGDAPGGAVAPRGGPNGASGGEDHSVPARDVTREQVIGFVDGRESSTPVCSPFPGRLMGLLAHAGERVREGQPVAWLRMAH